MSSCANRSWIVFGTFLHCLVNKCWEQVLDQFLRCTSEHYFRTVLETILKSSWLASITLRLQNSPGNSPGNSSEKRQVFGAISQSSYKLSSWLNKNLWSCICFTFSRFLLIYQLEGLDLSFTLKWFFFLKYFRTLSQNRSENRIQTIFKSKSCTNEFHVFILDYGLAFLGYLR